VATGPIYAVEITRPAAKQIGQLPRAAQIAVVAKLESLRPDPRPHGVEKMSGEENLYRVRVGNYRIIYSIEDRRLTVWILKVGDRKDVYRGL
jgi:mRNA interferase RelE/StbE